MPVTDGLQCPTDMSDYYLHHPGCMSVNAQRVAVPCCYLALKALAACLSSGALTCGPATAPYVACFVAQVVALPAT